MTLLSYPIFDSHFHIIDPSFPLIPNQGYVPDYFTIENYKARTASFNIAGGAIVTASFQGFDQSYLLAALQRLGSGFVGVTQLLGEVADEEILRLNAAGVRAIRFNLFRGGTAMLDQLETMAHRVYDLAQWHTELYIDARMLPDIETRLQTLPKICIDHLGLYQDGLPHLLRLVEHGAYVKATGFGRGDLNIPETLRTITAINSDALIFGTDLPSTRAKRPFLDSDVTLLMDTLGELVGKQALYENAVALYKPYVRN